MEKFGWVELNIKTVQIEGFNDNASVLKASEGGIKGRVVRRRYQGASGHPAKKT